MVLSSHFKNIHAETLRHLLIEPSTSIEANESRHWAQLLSLLLLLTAFTAFVGFVIYGTVSIGAVSIALAAIYGLSRTRYYLLATAFGLALLCVMPFSTFAAQASYNASTIFIILAWLSLPLLIGTLIHPFRGTLLIGVVLFAAILLLTRFTSQLPLAGVSGFLSYIATISTLATIAEVIRHHHQAQISQQLAELKSAQEDLQITLDAQTAQTTQMEQLNDRLSAILNSTSDAIILAGMDGSIRQTNRAFSTLFGYYPDETFGYFLTSLFDTNRGETFARQLQTVMDGKGKHRGRVEIVAVRKDQTTFDVDLSLSPVNSRGGEAWGIICSIRDITEQKQAEENLRQALSKEQELNELKTRFVSIASHEFRTPLTTIRTSGELLHEHRDRMTPEQIERHFHKIDSQVQHMTLILNDVLALGSMQTQQANLKAVLTPIDPFLREIVEEQRGTLRDNHKLSYSCSNPAVQACVDQKLLRQIVTNLLTNAIKYSPAGGVVGFEVTEENEDLVLRISDQGIGIPEQDQARLFDTFHRAGNVGGISGTGLGLAITKQAVELHGGTIVCESTVGVGTTFIVRLPR